VWFGLSLPGSAASRIFRKFYVFVAVLKSGSTTARIWLVLVAIVIVACSLY